MKKFIIEDTDDFEIRSIKSFLNKSGFKNSDFNYSYEGVLPIDKDINEILHTMDNLIIKHHWYKVPKITNNLLRFMDDELADKFLSWVIINKKYKTVKVQDYIQNPINLDKDNDKIYLCDINPECLQIYLTGIIQYQEINYVDTTKNKGMDVYRVIDAQETKDTARFVKNEVWRRILKDERVDTSLLAQFSILIGDKEKAKNIISKYKKQKSKNRNKWEMEIVEPFILEPSDCTVNNLRIVKFSKQKYSKETDFSDFKEIEFIRECKITHTGDEYSIISDFSQEYYDSIYKGKRRIYPELRRTIEEDIGIGFEYDGFYYWITALEYLGMEYLEGYRVSLKFRLNRTEQNQIEITKGMGTYFINRPLHLTNQNEMEEEDDDDWSEDIPSWELLKKKVV